MAYLLDLALSRANLDAAWHRVCEDDGGPGGDGISIADFGARSVDELEALTREVRSGTYAPGRLREIELPRIGREPRRLAVPCVRDRVLQKAVAHIMSPIVERRFHDGICACRPGRTVADAIEQMFKARRRGLSWVVNANIAELFDSIPHRILLERLATVLADASLDHLVTLWLSARIAAGLTRRQCPCGLTQGSPLSPLLARLYLDRFDACMRNTDRGYMRHADDFAILCRDYADAEQALEAADAQLREDGLELDFSRTRIASFAEGFTFLGVRFMANRQWTLTPEAGHGLLSGAPQDAPNIAMSDGDIDDIDDGADGDADAFRDESRVSPLLRTLHVTEQGAYVHRRGGRLVVSREDKDLYEIPLEGVDQVCVAQEGAISFGAMRELLARKAGFVLTGGAGEPIGWLEDLTGGNVALHCEQFRRADDPAFRLRVASAMVAGKIANCRLILRRYARFRNGTDAQADGDLAHLGRRLAKAATMDVLMGLEGAAARRYFSAFGRLLGEPWNFSQRNRRPPRDPVNVLLSYGYAILFQNVLTLTVRRGLNPHVGSLHATAKRHPALVSDLMEEFRPLVVDAVVLKQLLNAHLKPEHFEHDVGGYPCRLTSAGRHIFVHGIEQKLNTPLQHPRSGQRIDLRRAIAGQANQLADLVSQRATDYHPFVLH